MKNLVLLFVVWCALCVPVFAWNDVGHKLTGYIAWQQLTPQVREKVIAILMKAPEDSGLVQMFPQDSRSSATKQREFFMIATTWSDIVRDRALPLRNKYHRSNWHYADTFWKIENGVATIVPNPNEDGGKAIEQLLESEKTLRNPAATDAEKAIALAWFLHLAGDIHQPLHTSARITDLEPKGDQGGNLFSLTPKDTPRENQMNLHWFWDSIINRSVERRNDEPDGAYLPPVAEKFMRKYPVSQHRPNMNYAEWQKESFAIAMAEVFPASLKREQMPPKDYVKRAFQISEQQIARAGYRIADLLNSAFGPQTTATEPPCRIIRRIPYPVTMTRSEVKGTEIALLDLCPPDKGMVARPMTGLMIGGEIKMFEYAVIRTFKNEREAKEFAAANNITDIGF